MDFPCVLEGADEPVPTCWKSFYRVLRRLDVALQ